MDFFLRFARSTAVIALLLLPAALFAQAKSRSNTRIVIFDFLPSDPENPISNRIFSLSSSDGDALATRLRGIAATLRASGKRNQASSAVTMLKLVRDGGKDLARKGSNRWVSTKGDTLQIVILRPAGRTATLKVDEASRQTRIATDLATLAQVAQKLGMLADKAPAGAEVEFTFKEHYLTETRATVTVSAALESKAGADAGAQSKPKTGAPAAPAPEDEQSPAQLATSITTGPKEHFFLSSNAALTSVRQVKYDSKTRSFDTNEKPSEFLIGVNYALGDLIEDDPASSIQSFLNGLFVSLLVEGSKKPFNQIAATIGMRHNLPRLDSFVSFQTVSPYAGVIWAQNDKPDSPGSTKVVNKYGRAAMLWGLSLNLDKALGWLGDGKKDAAPAKGGSD